MACLAKELSDRGHHVRYMAAEQMSLCRTLQGWTPPDIGDVQLDYIADVGQVDKLLKDIAPSSVHLVQGIRGNGYVGHVINRLKQRRARWGAVMEMVSEPVVAGAIKRLVYSWKLGRSSKKPDFVLAIGEKTPSWVTARGYPHNRIFPFTYFLDPKPVVLRNKKEFGSFKVGFVGQLIQRKRVDILIDALAFEGFSQIELVVVGSGPLEAELKAMSQKQLSHLKVQWLGQLPMAKAQLEISGLDCLVLPSRHDGWGAVVSEALMAGVPAICSDACGAAAAVHASGVGGVFASGDPVALRQLIALAKADGCLNPVAREFLARWAECFGVSTGAHYLSSILEFVYADGVRPLPPWLSDCWQTG